jgi:hypothetical protein
MIVTSYVKLQIIIVGYAIFASPEGRFGADLFTQYPFKLYSGECSLYLGLSSCNLSH